MPYFYNLDIQSTLNQYSQIIYLFDYYIFYQLSTTFDIFAFYPNGKFEELSTLFTTVVLTEMHQQLQ